MAAEAAAGFQVVQAAGQGAEAFAEALRQANEAIVNGADFLEGLRDAVSSVLGLNAYQEKLERVIAMMSQMANYLNETEMASKNQFSEARNAAYYAVLKSKLVIKKIESMAKTLKKILLESQQNAKNKKGALNYFKSTSTPLMVIVDEVLNHLADAENKISNHENNIEVLIAACTREKKKKELEKSAEKTIKTIGGVATTAICTAVLPHPNTVAVGVGITNKMTGDTSEYYDAIIGMIESSKQTFQELGLACALLRRTVESQIEIHTDVKVQFEDAHQLVQLQTDNLNEDGVLDEHAFDFMELLIEQLTTLIAACARSDDVQPIQQA